MSNRIHYTLPDGPNSSDSWSVWSEERIDGEMVHGSTLWVSSHPTQHDADQEAARLDEEGEDEH